MYENTPKTLKNGHQILLERTSYIKILLLRSLDLSQCNKFDSAGQGIRDRSTRGRATAVDRTALETLSRSHTACNADAIVHSSVHKASQKSQSVSAIWQNFLEVRTFRLRRGTIRVSRESSNGECQTRFSAVHSIQVRADTRQTSSLISLKVFTNSLMETCIDPLRCYSFY